MEFLGLQLKIAETIQDNKESGLYNTFWKVLEKPLKTVCKSKLSTSCWFTGYGRLPRHPVPLGVQSTILGKELRLYV